MSFDVRPTRDREEFRAALYAIAQYFSGPPSEERLDRFLGLHGLERMHAAFDGDAIVGAAGAYSFDFSVPGGSLPCAGVTVVGTYPTHRRRGVLTSVMRTQLDDIHDRGEPIAALWASEERIYGRFGYGIASWWGAISVPRSANGFTVPVEPRLQARFVEREAAAAAFAPVWDVLRTQRTGTFARSEAWWNNRRLFVPEDEAAHPRRFVALEHDGEVRAYAIYKPTFAFEDGAPSSKIDVLEAVGVDPDATAEIWRFLLDIDWIQAVTAMLLPPDHPLFFLLAEPRRARYRMSDGLWVRLVDVGAALSGRAYLGDGSVVFDVRDTFCPWNEGRWKLDGGVAARTVAPADIALDVGSLGAAYLGAVSFTQLRDSLRLEELTPGAVARADAIFAWRPLPWCPEIF
jgi:predicted acetyltransferase